MLRERGVPWPAHVPVVSRPLPLPTDARDVIVTFIGHATFLIQSVRGTFITDPVFAQRAGPWGLAGPSRVRAPGLRLTELPPITAVLLSHNHYDHCDLAALRAIGAPVITLAGNARLLRRAGVTTAQELDWWAAATAPGAGPGDEAVQVTAVPAQHFSARTPFDRNRALWGGFVIDIAGRRLYFAGDSGYGPHFRAIGQRFGPFDLALIPIGAYEPRWFMRDIHMNPEEAVQAHQDVGARRSLGMHFGTFQLTTEGIDEPVEALARAREAAGIGAQVFQTLEVGASFRL